jgi:uncharacterized repeat protein (TIGR02543 family)
MVTAAGTLYAIWQQNPAGVFTVNYAKNDGSADNQDEDYTDGDTTALTFTNPFTRFGYTFLGWATTAGATSPATSYTVTADATLYAVWQVNSYTITYRLNDGSQTSATHAYNYGATNALSFVNPWTRDGFNFLGWSIDPNATEADASYTVTGDAELFAIWETAGPATVSGFPNRTKSVTLGFYALVAPTTNSPGAITYTATCAGVATVSGSMVTLLAAGTCQITATIAAAPGFAETTITMTLTITPAIVYIPVTPPSGNTPTVTPDSNANLTLEYKKPQGKVTLQSTNTTDPNENWTLNLQGTDPKGTPTPLNANKQLEFEDGNKVATHGEGFAPNTPVVVYIGGVKIGTVTTDSNGSFSGSFLIPQSVRPGVKIIQVNGITHGNTVRSVSLPIIIRKGGAGTIKKSVYFLGDSPKVTGHGGMVLQSILKLLRSKKNIVVNVSGWVKETADKSYDIKLSHDRAQNMVHVLRDIYKIKAKYSYKGYGISPEGTDKSRRADIVVTFTN